MIIFPLEGLSDRNDFVKYHLNLLFVERKQNYMKLKLFNYLILNTPMQRGSFCFFYLSFYYFSHFFFLALHFLAGFFCHAHAWKEPVKINHNEFFLRSYFITDSVSESETPCFTFAMVVHPTLYCLLSLSSVHREFFSDFAPTKWRSKSLMFRFWFVCLWNIYFACSSLKSIWAQAKRANEQEIHWLHTKT